MLKGERGEGGMESAGVVDLSGEGEKEASGDRELSGDGERKFRLRGISCAFRSWSLNRPWRDRLKEISAVSCGADEIDSGREFCFSGG